MNVKTILVLVISVLGIACNKDDSPVSNTDSTNLITNGSFEINGDSSISGWLVNLSSDISSRYVHFSEDVPPGGSKWSLMIENPDSSVVEIHSSIKTSTGKHSYKLSFWAKSNNNENFGMLHYRWSSNATYGDYAKILDSTWRQYSVTYNTFDTLKINDSTYAIADSARSINVSLYTIYSKVSTRAYFDLIKLEQLN